MGVLSDVVGAQGRLPHPNLGREELVLSDAEVAQSEGELRHKAGIALRSWDAARTRYATGACRLRPWGRARQNHR